MQVHFTKAQYISHHPKLNSHNWTLRGGLCDQFTSTRIFTSINMQNIHTSSENQEQSGYNLDFDLLTSRALLHHMFRILGESGLVGEKVTI